MRILSALIFILGISACNEEDVIPVEEEVDPIEDSNNWDEGRFDKVTFEE